MSRLALIDPLTLMGREIAAEITRSRSLWEEPVLFHTTDNDEHQIAQMSGKATLVPPLENIEELSDCDVVVLASDVEERRMEHIDELLETRPDVLFVDASSGDRYLHLTSPAMDADGLASGNRLRLAHPAVVVAATVLDTLRNLGPEFLSLFAIDPVSVFGKGAVEALARQSIQRLQGALSEEPLGGQTLAFNIAPVPGNRLTVEASMMLPGIEVAAMSAMAGVFHGHLVQLGIVFEAPVTTDELVEKLAQNPGITVGASPLNLNVVPDRDDILISEPHIALNGRTAVLSAIADGTRIGGAFAASAIIRGLT